MEIKKDHNWQKLVKIDLNWSKWIDKNRSKQSCVRNQRFLDTIGLWFILWKARQLQLKSQAPIYQINCTPRLLNHEYLHPPTPRSKMRRGPPHSNRKFASCVMQRSRITRAHLGPRRHSIVHLGFPRVVSTAATQMFIGPIEATEEKVGKFQEMHTPKTLQIINDLSDWF